MTKTTTDEREAIDQAWEAYVNCDHDQDSPTYRPMSVCDVCRGRASEESFEWGYLAGAAREEWVAVEIRLPEEDGWYLCTLCVVQTDESEKLIVGQYLFNSDRKGWFQDWDTDFEYPNEWVTAWMELPEPFRPTEKQHDR